MSEDDVKDKSGFSIRYFLAYLMIFLALLFGAAAVVEAAELTTPFAVMAGIIVAQVIDEVGERLKGWQYLARTTPEERVLNEDRAQVSPFPLFPLLILVVVLVVIVFSEVMSVV